MTHANTSKERFLVSAVVDAARAIATHDRQSPTDGRYISRSAITVPMGNKRFDTGRMPKNAIRNPIETSTLRRKYAASAIASSSATQLATSTTVPVARRICGYE